MVLLSSAVSPKYPGNSNIPIQSVMNLGNVSKYGLPFPFQYIPNFLKCEENTFSGMLRKWERVSLAYVWQTLGLVFIKYQYKLATV